MKKMTTLMLAALAYAGASAFAADYPNKPVRFIVAFPPGSATDIVGRLYTQKWTEMWGHQVIADNRPGAGGSIAAAIAAKSTADGYTLLMHSSGHTVNPSLYAKLPFDTLKDFVDIGPLAQQPNVMVTHPSTSYQTVQDVLKAAMAKPGALNFASAGVGSGTHLNLEKLKLMAKINMNHVPYKGSAEALADVLGNRVDFYFAPISTTLAHVQGNRVRAIAVSTIKRSSILPTIPTIAESGVPGYAAGSWYGYVAPARTPAAILRRLSDEIVKISNTPAFADQLKNNVGAEPDTMPAEKFGQFLAAETEKWAKVIKLTGATLE